MFLCYYLLCILYVFAPTSCYRFHSQSLTNNFRRNATVNLLTTTTKTRGYANFTYACSFHVMDMLFFFNNFRGHTLCVALNHTQLQRAIKHLGRAGDSCGGAWQAAPQQGEKTRGLRVGA